MSLTRSPVGGVCRAVTRAVTDPALGGWTPNAAFFAGTPGVAFDLTDMGTLYQDSGRTTLVSATGQPIGSATDLSGNGKHATQATTAQKPAYQGYASLDGVDDGLVTPALALSGTDAITVVASIRKSSDAATGIVLELTGNSGINAAFALFAPVGAAATFGWRSRGTADSLATSPASYAAPTTVVLTGSGDISADTCALRVNGAQAVAQANDQGTGNYAADVLFIGRRNGASSPFNGRLYRILVIGRALTADEISRAERWCAQPAGVTLA